MRKNVIGSIVLVVVAFVSAFVLVGRGIAMFAPPPDSISPVVSGKVSGPDGLMAGAVVQVRGTPITAVTNEKGQFSISGLTGNQPIILTAWSPGYYIGSFKVEPGGLVWATGKGAFIKMKPHYQTDNFKYDWFDFEGVQGSASCGLCHREYPEWQADAHSQSAVNPRFIAIYRGSDVAGNEGTLTSYNTDGTIREKEAGQSDFGPGYRLDNPQRAGNCATCHTPMAAKIPNQNNCGWSGCHTDLTSEHARGSIDYGVLPVSLSGDAAEGISCDFCHKIGEVHLDAETGLPRADMPGILSYRLYRPTEGNQVFFGTLIDMPRRDTYLPLLERSEYCAPCHYGVFGGVVGHGTVTGGTLIYNSYGEWLESPYANEETGQTCQDCHMPHVEEKFTVFAERGGITRDYFDFHNHTMPGAADSNLLQNSVSLTAEPVRSGGELSVSVTVTNDQTGHHVPTDAPMRQMILVVQALDENGKALKTLSGPLNPEWAGNFAGMPGKTFMKVLRDEMTGEMPTAAYWRPVTIAEDTRLAALASDTTRYVFDLPAGQAAQVKVSLVFRRNYQTLMEQKGFTDADILMEEVLLQVGK